jgi:hypothetical protein
MATAAWAVTATASTTGILAEFDPTITPTRASFWPFLFVAVALILLMISMVRHLRRARENLGSERSEFPGFPQSEDPQQTSPDASDQSR